jgi:hypothetical protein
MLDIIAALALGAMFAVDVTVLVGLAALRPEVKVTAFAIAAAWAATVVTIGALGGFVPGAIGQLPAPMLAFSAVVLVGFVAWFLSPAFRHALLSVPLAALVGVNAFRIGGIFFLLLFAGGRLSAPFAQSAGWGDIITGLLAIPLAARATSARALFRPMIAAWNAFGALDLLVDRSGFPISAWGPRTACSWILQEQSL